MPEKAIETEVPVIDKSVKFRPEELA